VDHEVALSGIDVITTGKLSPGTATEPFEFLLTTRAEFGEAMTKTTQIVKVIKMAIAFR
jgi:hypothetical protein